MTAGTGEGTLAARVRTGGCFQSPEGTGVDSTGKGRKRKGGGTIEESRFLRVPAGRKRSDSGAHNFHFRRGFPEVTEGPLQEMGGGRRNRVRGHKESRGSGTRDRNEVLYRDPSVSGA